MVHHSVTFPTAGWRADEDFYLLRKLVGPDQGHVLLRCTLHSFFCLQIFPLIIFKVLHLFLM